VHVDSGGAEMSGRFEYYKDKTGKFHFRLLTASGDIVLLSEPYKSKLGCTKGIESVRVNASNPDNYVRETTSNGGHRFKLLSLNGRVIGISRNHDTAAAYSGAMAIVSRLAGSASIHDQT
jgi:uncharacterized protein YegP (UPF0339 family)